MSFLSQYLSEQVYLRKRDSKWKGQKSLLFLICLLQTLGTSSIYE